MKTYRVLGILWLAVCTYFGLTLLWGLRPIVTVSNVSFTPDLYIVIVMCLFYLFGVPASVFLFRGAVWARRMVCLIAIETVAACIGLLLAARQFPVSLYFLGAFALISAVILLLPRRQAT